MTPAGYVRPALEIGEYRDESGAVIPYGRRWEGPPHHGSPPKWAYSTCPHPERCAPLTEVAEAIVAFLAVSYVVEVEVFEDVDPAAPPDALSPSVRAHLRHRAAWGVFRARAVVLTPPDPAAASLTFLLTVADDGFPGLVVFAGQTLDHHGAGCGCDACDDSIGALADDLEQFVFAVVEGHAFERMRGRGVERGYVVPEAGGAGSLTPRGQVSRDVRRRVKADLAVRGSGDFRAWVSP